MQQDKIDPKIYAATVYLAAVCDGAVSEDGTGFNKYDAVIGHSLSTKPFNTWSGRQVSLMYRVLRKYKNQLHTGGIDYDSITVPGLPEINPTVNHRSVEIEDNRIGNKFFMIRFPYDAFVVDSVRVLPNRKWDNDTKVWSVPVQLGTIEPVLQFALSHNFELSDTEVLKYNVLKKNINIEVLLIVFFEKTNSP